VLTAIAEQGTVPAAAQSLGMTRQATESLLKRARAVMRSRLAKTLTALGILQLRRLRPLSTGGTATGLAALAAVLMMVLPQLAPWVVPGTEAPGRHPLHAGSDVATSPAHLWSTGARGHRRQGLPPSARLVGSARAMPIDPPVVVVPPHRINVGPIEQDDGGQGVVIKHASDSALKSVRDCLRDGVVVSKTFIGCKAAQKSSA
jgi:hypothetical protein